MSYSFANQRNTNKVVINIADQYATNNNAGFNLANFKPKFITEFFDEVVQDYERSFIGAFAHSLLNEYCGQDSNYELYFSVSKFEGNMGYALTQNYNESNSTFDLHQPDEDAHMMEQLESKGDE